MSNYSKATNFATKDTLSTGNPSKIVKGTELDTEFNAIASAITSKIEQSNLDALTGRIKQIVTATTGTKTSTTGTTFIDSAVTASITPTSTSSVILVLVSASQLIYNYTTEMNTRIMRNSTQVAGSYKIFKAWLPSEGTAKELWVPTAMSVYDNPSTTASVTYTVQFKCQASTGGSVSYGSNDTDASVITLVEIL